MSRRPGGRPREVVPPVWYMAAGLAALEEQVVGECSICEEAIDGPALVNVRWGGWMHLPMACPEVRWQLRHDA